MRVFKVFFFIPFNALICSSKSEIGKLLSLLEVFSLKNFNRKVMGLTPTYVSYDIVQFTTDME